jgi:hypothetical protein
MSAPDLAPRGTFGGVIGVWVLAGLLAIAIGIFVPENWQPSWTVVAMAGCLILTFVVQLAYGRAERFVQRVALSGLGALLLIGVISAVFGIFTLVPV